MSKIVVVEDEQPIREMYRMKLESSGYNVAVAKDGEEGFRVVEEFRPDLLLLDLRMPKVSGQEMLHKIRETDWGNNILVIILTNLSQSEASLDLRLLKVEKYIVKAHSTPKQVVEEVETALGRHGKPPPKTSSRP